MSTVEAPVGARVASRTHGGPAHIRSFHPRRSRTTPTAASALTRLLPVWGIDPATAPSRLSEVFQPELPTVLEIGSGMGETTLAMAAASRGVGIVAVDVHTPGIGALLAGVERAHLDNVRVSVGDAVELMDRLEPESLVGIRVFFPDPWPKSRHHKRRLVQPAFVRHAAQLLVPGGVLHLATDVAAYAEHMRLVCAAEPLLEGAVLRDRPLWRPITRFEARGTAAGRRSQDLVAIRR